MKLMLCKWAIKLHIIALQLLLFEPLISASLVSEPLLFEPLISSSLVSEPLISASLVSECR